MIVSSFSPVRVVVGSNWADVRPLAHSQTEQAESIAAAADKSPRRVVSRISDRWLAEYATDYVISCGVVRASRPVLGLDRASRRGFARLILRFSRREAA
jgi:hypothetical protein